MARRRRQARCALPLAAALLAAGCDESFSPIAPTDLQYSVFGYLDASADTQWIRVGPIRELAVTAPEPFDATVTLEQVASGRTIQLRDSLFLFTDYDDPEVGGEGIWSHVYWTTERIEPGASYRFTVTRSGLKPAEAVIEVPPEYGVEIMLRQPRTGGTDTLRLTGVEHVPFVVSTTELYDRCGSLTERKSFPVRSSGGVAHRIPVTPVAPPARAGCGGLFTDRASVWVVGSQAEWPAGQEYATGNLGVPEEVSNISNSLGFIGGVLTRRLPYEICEFLGPDPVPAHCVLRYDENTATIYGTATERRCGGVPFDTLNVQLWELEPGAGGRSKMRRDRTNRAGFYEISGLEPGKQYVLRPVSPTSPGQFGPVQRYTQLVDTVSFAPGERKQYDIGLSKLDDCSISW